MSRVLVTARLVGWVALVVCCSQNSRGDVVVLHSGGQVRGVLQRSSADAVTGPSTAGSGTVTLETVSGVQITLPAADVADATQRPLVHEQYETRARAAENTVASQWELATWCDQNGLGEQQRKHLQAVIDLDPDHQAARTALGYVRHAGHWQKKADWNRAHGLVKYDRRWMTPQQRDALINDAALRKRQDAWHSDIRTWHAWLTGSNAKRSFEALQEIRAIRDPLAIPALVKYFQNDPNSGLRIKYVAALKRIPGSLPSGPLVWQYLYDVDPTVRDAALNAIVIQHPERALTPIREALGNESNKVVCRAGAALEQLGDERAVPDLIESLVTTHKRTIQVPERIPTISFTNNGAYGYGGIPLPPEIAIALRTGHLPFGVDVVGAGPRYRLRNVTIRVNQTNEEVLAALEKITGVNFHFNENQWQQWWAGKKSGL